jgi:phosphate transport system substrate-binding protein
MEKAMSRVSIIRICVFVLVGAALALGIYFWPTYAEKKDKETAAAHLKVGGTSVVSVVMTNGWRAGYKKAKDVVVDYESIGSTKGVTEVIDKMIDIGFTHGALTEEQKKLALSRGGELLQVPVVLCAVVPVYNVKELKGKAPLKFTGEVLADIFLGKIDKWNDPALKKLNEGVELPDTKIIVVHREDSSGTTLIFTDYLQGTSAAWKKEFPVASSELKWKVGVAMPRNQGVGVHVFNTEGAIGYVDLVHIYQGTSMLDYGAVQNKDGSDFIHVEAENMTAAAKALGADLPDDLTFSLTNKAGKESYPICGGIWAVCYQNQPTPAVANFLQWVMNDGQHFASKMNYAPLPPELVQRVEQKLKAFKTAP